MTRFILPLVTIKGFLGYLKKDIASGGRQRIEIDLGLVGDAVERMEALLVRALDVSSIGKLSNTRERVPYDEIVQEALSLATDKISTSKSLITVANDFPVVNVDRARIVDVLVNLIENCIRHAGNTGPLKIEIGYQVKEVETVFFVKDDGQGIDPAMQKDIFRLFYRGSEAENSHAGLALSRRIIEVHGGRMWIESVVDKGCTVYFTIP
jgi:light-regulated signal transduction histidine kinase (bacteriophytochrome)